MAKKYVLKSVEGSVGADGKLEIPKGAKYTTLSTMVELPIKNGKRAGQTFIVSEVGEGVDKNSIDQFFATKYQGQATGSRAPSYVLTHRAAGAPADQSSLICSLFLKKYENGQTALVGKKGTTRFYMEDAEIAEARRLKHANKSQA